MLAWDYYIIKESKNKFKDWTQAGLEHLRKQYKNLQDEKERKRVKKILDDLNGSVQNSVSALDNS